MRTILMIVLGLFIAKNLHAQTDSLIIKLENYGQLIIISPNLVTEKQKSFGLDSCFQNFYKDFEKIDRSKFIGKNQLIKYSYKEYEPQYRTISIEEAPVKENVFFYHGDKQQSLISGKYKIELSLERKVVLILDTLNDLERIGKLSLDTLYIQSMAHMQKQNLNRRITYKTFYSIENQNIKEGSNMIYTGKIQDFLILNAIVGASVINSKLAPEWGANMDFDFRKKGIPFLKFGLNYNVMYLYNKDDIFDISSYGFLNLHYYFKFGNNYTHKMGVGYLVNKSGNDFNGNTWTAWYSANIKEVGFKFGGFITKNPEGKYLFMPSIGIEVGF